ncbi:putative type-2 protein geranylgeranyltransferase subunit beta protein [Erysiphe necator]|uniref:Putative type-2 protein geranylgeranyltransferase subunit beta protein n=1 Tax=Uncinula necator TaxID=52586 RepID=A0A0B1P2E3_UNCNE|nr:putative type-2 protein geranylgeranyltransferase subunit beta protein [Erysiphe necator]
MSSKGHLAHRFKLQIRSQGEPEARQRLENFDIWYHANNLDSLLSERLAAKEQKRGTKSREDPCNISKAKKNLQTGRHCFAPENQTFRAPIPRMHQWPSTVDGVREYRINDWQNNVNYDTLSDKNTLQVSPNGEVYDRLESQSNSSSRSTKDLKEKSADDSDEFIENAKLKGVLWPGMNLFDSATLEQKRMRNQRKGNEVLVEMMKTSEQVAPAEVSYHATGEFRASRDIFGPLSGDDSPIKDPTPKKRKSVRRAPALKDLNTNVPRSRIPSEKKTKKAVFSPKKQIDLDLSSVLTNSSLNPLTAGLEYNRQFQSTTDEDEEFRLTFSDNLHGKKRGFNIFQDSSIINPGRIETPLQDQKLENLAPSIPDPETQCINDKNLCFQNSLSPFSSQVKTISSVAKTSPNSSLRKSQGFWGKENLQPNMNRDSLDRNSTSSSHFFPSQLFYETPLNPLYHHGCTRSYSCVTQNDRIGIKSPNFSTFNGDYRPINPLAGAKDSATCSTNNTLQFKF